MAGAFLVAPMRAADLEQVAAMERGVSAPWSEAQIKGEQGRANGFQLVIRGRVNGRVWGYVCGRMVSDEAEIFKIAVADRCRRQGIASALLGHALGKLRREGTRLCFLEFRATNEPARLLYEKIGFQAEGKRRRYYANPREDAVLMGMRLDLEGEDP